MRYGCVDWSLLAQGKAQFRALVNTVVNVQIFKA
jgi:hypothetical protein